MSNDNQESVGENLWIAAIVLAFLAFGGLLSMIPQEMPKPKNLGEAIRQQQMIQDYKAAQWRKANGLGTLSDHILY